MLLCDLAQLLIHFVRVGCEALGGAQDLEDFGEAAGGGEATDVALARADAEEDDGSFVGVVHVLDFVVGFPAWVVTAEAAVAQFPSADLHGFEVSWSCGSSKGDFYWLN